mmetsp:Transcript_5541/g.10408  ORF Transcript_5541/g.10408 Transcript_5541/m.10408 type:complete len:104 (-) Transcript_5541:41-352(-)
MEGKEDAGSEKSLRANSFSRAGSKTPEQSNSSHESADVEGQEATLKEVLLRTGLVFSERGNLTEVLCKPKILPLKSATLLRMEQLEAKARENAAAEVENEQRN